MIVNDYSNIESTDLLSQEVTYTIQYHSVMGKHYQLLTTLQFVNDVIPNIWWEIS